MSLMGSARRAEGTLSDHEIVTERCRLVVARREKTNGSISGPCAMDVAAGFAASVEEAAAAIEGVPISIVDTAVPGLAGVVFISI